LPIRTTDRNAAPAVASFQLAVSPRIVTSSARQMAFVVNGAPLSFLQVVQWHRPTLTGWPLASIRMAPQLQVAVRVQVIRALLARVP
jgi:hypothetical protein